MSGKVKDGLDIPDFLLAKNRPAPKKYHKPQERWIMPDMRESKSSRRQKKEEHDKIVCDAINKGLDTFQKIRKEIDLEKNEISNSLRRNLKARRIKQVGRRYYPR
jgi:hypothetical protein